MRFVRFLLLPVVIIWLSFTPAQEPKTKRSVIHIEHADFMEGSQRFGKNVQALFGNVRFRHLNTLMHCDSAFLYRDSNRVEAYGSIHIIQNDTIHLYGKELFYFGNDEMAKVRKNVRMVNKDVVLTTEFLDYDRRNDVAYYYNGGKITSGDNVLTSSWGYYYPKTEEAHFRNNVVATNPEYKMYSDTMKYHTITEVVKIVGPTTIISDRNTIYSEAGYYDTKQNFAQLEKNNSVKGDDQLLTGDTIFYNRNNGFGEVFSRMALHDSANHIIITGNYGYYNEITKRALAIRKAVMMQIQQNDTLFLHADTLRADPIPDSEHRMVRAYRNVKFFRIDFQGRCDSMVYDFRDSINTFYKNPVIWAQENQMTAETIRLFTRNKSLYKAELINNAFVISMEDSMHFNQIKGKLMTGYIRNNQLYRIDVDGNGQTIYYPKDDDVMIGVNRAESSNLTLLLEDRKVTSIILRNQPAGNLNPPLILPIESQRLEGFRWLEEYRPKKMSDIFIKDKPPAPVNQTNYSEFFFDRTLPKR